MKSRTAKRRQEAEADAHGATVDLFAVADAAPAAPSGLAPIPPAPSILPTPRTAGHRRSKQLWYAVVFPGLTEAGASGLMLQKLCLYAQQFTSFVSIEAPDALLLEIKGSLKLLGPLESLHADIDACWRRLALPAHSAAAPSTLAALWLARNSGHPRAGNSGAAQPVQIEEVAALAGRLAELPIACTAWASEWLQTLRAMGVTRVGEVLRLPRAGLARRLGPAAVQDLDIALAREFAPRRTFVPRERFRARCDFESEIETVAYLEKALEPLIARCAQFLRERQAGVQGLRLRLRHRTGPATDVPVGLASITGEPRRLTDVLTQKLTRLELSAPVRSLELMSGSLLPLIAGSLDVFAASGGGAGTGAGCGRDSVPQLVERLRARLGEEAVYGVVSIPEHRPEAAWRRVHELPQVSIRRVGETMTTTGDGMPRPVWLLDAPLALSESDLREFHQSGLVLEQGPERIESGWWDGRGVARDYYIARRISSARRSRGAKLWVFQERQSKRWYLHGMFA